VTCEIVVDAERALGRLDPSIANWVPSNLNSATPANNPHCDAKLRRSLLRKIAIETQCREHLPWTLLWSLHLLARYALLRYPFQYRDANTAQLADVTKAIKSILGDENVETELAPAYQKYNEEQFTTTKLPGGSTEILISPYNSLGDGRYYDAETQSSFDFDHATQKASAVQSYVVESQHEDLV